MTGPSSPETWDAFFSDFYLRAYAADEREGEAEAQALAAARLAACPEGGELLDVPCGFGRHSVPLAPVTG
jgi:cyclopropane fatty-acyl-phospholipid synthase-like methyltransferase